MAKSLEERVAALEAAVFSRGGSTSSSDDDAKPASDADLDGQYGDPQIRKDPTARYWTGRSYVGKTLSQCPADYLRAFARYKQSCAFMNDKAGDPQKAKYAGYDRKDASRAVGWALRIESGRTAAPPPSPTSQTGGSSGDYASDFGGDSYADDTSDIPFVSDAMRLGWWRP
jgi:hypothetical protein